MILIALIFHCASSKSIGVFEDLFLSNSRLTAGSTFLRQRRDTSTAGAARD